MIARTLLVLCTVLLFGCEYMEYKDDPPKGDDGSVVVNELSSTARRELGIEAGNPVVIVIPDSGAPSLFLAPGSGTRRAEFPERASAILKGFSVTGYEKNPDCFLWWDFFGNHLIVPSPPC